MVKFISKALSTLTLRKRGAKTRKRRPSVKRKKAEPPSGDATVTNTEPATETIETIESLEDELVESPVSASETNAEPVAAPVAVAAREEIAEAPETLGARPMTAERRALIREALAVQKSKAKLLDELSPEQRRKLRILARKALLGE